MTNNKMKKTQCKAKNKNGTQCKRKATHSGFCNLHDPTRQKNKKRYDETIAIIKSICKAKGWRAYLENYDSQNWIFATIKVNQYFDDEVYSNEYNISDGDLVSSGVSLKTIACCSA